MSVTIRRCTELGWGYLIYDSNGSVLAMSVKPYDSFGAVVSDLNDLVGIAYFTE